MQYNGMPIVFSRIVKLKWFYHFTLHHMNILNRDRATVAEIDNEDGKADAASAAATVRMNMANTCPVRSPSFTEKATKFDVDRQQNQLDRH